MFPETKQIVRSKSWTSYLTQESSARMGAQDTYFVPYFLYPWEWIRGHLEMRVTPQLEELPADLLKFSNFSEISMYGYYQRSLRPTGGFTSPTKSFGISISKKLLCALWITIIKGIFINYVHQKTSRKPIYALLWWSYSVDHEVIAMCRPWFIHSNHVYLQLLSLVYMALLVYRLL